jgi:hypothetical protein
MPKNLDPTGRRPPAQPPVKSLPDNSQGGKTTNLQRLVTGRDTRRKSG